MIYFFYIILLSGFGIVFCEDKLTGFGKSGFNFFDFGLSIVITSISILIFFLFKDIKNFQDFKNMESLDSRQALVHFNIAWLSLFPSTVWYYRYRFNRGDYPPQGDTIAIPIASSFILYLLFWPLFIFIIKRLTKKAKLPTKIFFIPYSYSKKDIFTEIIFTILLILIFFATNIIILDGDHFTIPASLFFVFLLLTLRAGKLREGIVEVS